LKIALAGSANDEIDSLTSKCRNLEFYFTGAKMLFGLLQEFLNMKEDTGWGGEESACHLLVYFREEMENKTKLIRYLRKLG